MSLFSTLDIRIGRIGGYEYTLYYVYMCIINMTGGDRRKYAKKIGPYIWDIFGISQNIIQQIGI